MQPVNTRCSAVLSPALLRPALSDCLATFSKAIPKPVKAFHLVIKAHESLPPPQSREAISL